MVCLCTCALPFLFLRVEDFYGSGATAIEAKFNHLRYSSNGPAARRAQVAASDHDRHCNRCERECHSWRYRCYRRPCSQRPRTIVADSNGFFKFSDLDAGANYHVTISAKGFAKWTSPAIILKPGQYLILTGCKLQIAEAQTTVTVASSVATLAEIASEQVKKQEQQRVFGIIPNFYVVYDRDAVPLTPKLKFKLALKTSFDPVTIAGVAALAGIKQAGDTPNYVQGAKGYGERFGAITADGFSDIMIGGAILPSLLHQDPRYFYQGTGTRKSRALHALSNAFVCKGDNGQMQPNYSSMGGDLASAALSNAYYPASNRGAGLVFENFLIGTGERMARQPGTGVRLGQVHLQRQKAKLGARLNRF